VLRAFALAAVVGAVLASSGCGSSSTPPTTATGPRHAERVYTIPSIAMQPTLKEGARVTTDLDAYDSADPQRGDLVVFHPPLEAAQSDAACGASVAATSVCPTAIAREDRQTVSIKRIVAVPGDSIAMRNGRVYLDGKLGSENFPGCVVSEACDFPTPVLIPAGHYFTLGDNRGVSYDSRFWGAIPRSWIVGKIIDTTSG
jgi:signal peptidase I